MLVILHVQKRVHGCVHNVVQIACIAGRTEVTMHTSTQAVTALVGVAAQVVRCRGLVRGHDGVAPAPILRDRSGASRVRFAAPW
jgi:hypothetical protein